MKQFLLFIALFLPLAASAELLWSIDPDYFPDAITSTEAVQIWNNAYHFEGNEGCWQVQPDGAPAIDHLVDAPNRTPTELILAQDGLRPARRLLRRDRELNIFPPDQRIMFNEYTYPERAVGRFDSTAHYCTATLIAPNIILTNAHCVVDEPETGPRIMPDLAALREFSFFPALKNNQALDQARAIAIVLDETYVNASGGYPQDWALVMIDANLGHNYGWVGIQDTSIEAPILEALNPVSLTGYSYDLCQQTACTHNDCALRDTLLQGSFAEYLHDCDSLGGSSGSALLNHNHTIVALHHAHFDCDECVSNFTHDNANLAQPTHRVVQTLIDNAALFSDGEGGPTTFYPTCPESHGASDDDDYYAFDDPADDPGPADDDDGLGDDDLIDDPTLDDDHYYSAGTSIDSPRTVALAIASAIAGLAAAFASY